YDVRKDITPFEKIDFEKDYPFYASGGYIHYCEYPKLDHNIKALEAVGDYSSDKVSYLGTNIPIDHCRLCDFKGDFKTTASGYKCSECRHIDPTTLDYVTRPCSHLGNQFLLLSIADYHIDICTHNN